MNKINRTKEDAAELPAQPAVDHQTERDAEERAKKDELLDEALRETFPASDPISSEIFE